MTAGTAGAVPDPAVATPFAVAKTALRHQYTGVDETLAAMASRRQLSTNQINALADKIAAGASPSRRELAPLSAPGVAALAYWTVGGSRDETAVARAAALFGLARRLVRRDGGSAPHPDVALQVALASGQITPTDQQLVDGIDADQHVKWATRADLAHPFDAPTPDRLAAWYEVFDEPFTARGIEPIRIDAADDDPFAHLTTTSHGSRAGTIDGPLVSIVVPVYSTGSEDLLISINSVLAQTWANLQVIVVDDASPAEHREIFEQVAALDQRIEVLRKPLNGGAYVARNAGIAHARGEFVGIQDADDWSHPERIERQMAALQGDRDLIATLSQAVYLHRDLRISTIGTAPIGRHLPSLLFRRAEVLDRLGQFDTVRKAADGEFVERLIAACGRAAIRTLDEPLALYQLTDDSLSRNDFGIGWHRHTRVSYRSAYRRWHHRITEGEGDPRLLAGSPRPFPAPPELEGASGPYRFNVVVLADTRAGSVASASLVDQLTALSSSGLTVGLARAEPLRLATANRTYPASAIADVIAAGKVRWTSLTSDVDTDLLFVRDPDLLAARGAGTVQARPRRVVVVADHLPSIEGTSDGSYDPVAIELSARSLFGRPAEWLPASEEIAAALATAGASGFVHPPRLTEIVSAGSSGARPTLGRPILGVENMTAHRAERISDTTLRSHLPRGQHHDVRLHQPTRRSPDPTWLAFAADDITAEQLFDQCDFAIGLPSVMPGTGLIRPVLQAMARGCIPVVDDSHRTLFGDSALYYGEKTVAQVVDDCWNARENVSAMRQAARAWCADQLSAAAFLTTITSLRSTDSDT